MAAFQMGSLPTGGTNHDLAGLGYGLQGRGLSRSQIGVATEGVGESAGKFSAESNSGGDVIGEIARPEYLEKEIVELGPSDLAWVPSPHGSTSLGSLALDTGFGKEYSRAVTDTAPFRVTIPTGKSVTDPHQHPRPRSGVLFRFWHGLSCGMGGHRWLIGLGIGLDLPPRSENPLATLHVSGFDTYAARQCLHCGLTEILE